ALKLAEHKADVGFVSPKVVTLNDVQNQFGGGNTDPASLRNFLLYVYRNWSNGGNLAYVTLIGLGHYDYKNITTGQINFMPVAYRTDGSINSNSYNRVTDDYFVFFDTQLHPDRQHSGYYFLGRLPARSSSEAFDMVEKIIETESPAEANFDSWRNRVLLTADDDQQGSERDLQPPYHYSSSEDVAKVIWRNRPALDLRKVYLFEYPWDDYYAKPGASRAFINEINNGVAAVNWFGHGSDNQLADELMFSKSDVLALHNRKRYPVFSFFSCSVGKFDLPGNDCLSAQLVRQPRAGAIGVISAARSTYASNNEKLAEPFFDALFHPDDNMSIGAALQYGKYKSRYTDSDGRNSNVDNRYYIILGDPSITPYKQNRKVNLVIENSAGERIDTLKALQQIKITGEVKDAFGNRDNDFTEPNAFVNITLFNPPQDSVRRKDGGSYSDPKYELQGAPVFSAKVPVKDGKFGQTLILPMNLSFGAPGVRLSAYAFKDTLMGSGYLTGLVFYGSENSNISDTTGPKISVRPIYGNASMDMDTALFVKNRISAQLPLELEIRVEDESGVNVMGSGPDEGLTVEVSGSLSNRSINHFFQPWKGNFREYRGTYNFEENTLKSGVHELIISAQDLLGNISRQVFTLEILDQMDIKLDHVLNIPNPVKMGRETRFYYYHSNTDNHNNTDMTVIIRVYSLGGRLIKVIRNPQNGYAWIPRDERGNILTPNVYLYQVSVTSASLGKTTKGKIKKLVVHPPR
ncbi:MAG: C25 family cysteine peptidase, partial [Chitinispirillales bacterium]|nr:C25 family cysteine peptidase [Chitinispirillales bacterium]